MLAGFGKYKKEEEPAEGDDGSNGDDNAAAPDDDAALAVASLEAPAKPPRFTARGAAVFAALDAAGTGAVDAREAATALMLLKLGFGEVRTERTARG